MAALIVKEGNYPWHHGGVAVARTLGTAGVAVYAVVEHPSVPLARSRYTKGTFAVGRRLNCIMEALERPAVAVPTDDQAAIQLDEAGTVPNLLWPRRNPSLTRNLVNKEACARLAADSGFETPSQTTLLCPATSEDLRRISVPVIVKRTTRSLDAAGSHSFSTVLAERVEDLRRLLVETDEPFTVVLQPIIPGRDWLYHGYFNADCMPLASFTALKLRSRPAFAGETSYALTRNNLRLKRAVEAFLKSIRYTGVVSLDIREAAGTGAYVLLDVNPRVGACFRLFVDENGVDVIRAQYLDLTGRPPSLAAQRDGRTYMVENYDAEVRRHYRQSFLGWAGQAIAAERAWWQLRDPRPALARAGARTRNRSA